MLVGVTVRRAVFVSVLCLLCFLLSSISFCHVEFSLFISHFLFSFDLVFVFVLFCFCCVTLSMVLPPFFILSKNL